MLKADLHIDIPDIMKSWSYGLDVFFSDRKDMPVTYKMLKQAEIDVVGFSLYVWKDFVKRDYYKATKESLKIYKKIAEKSDGKIKFIPTIEGFECFRDIDDFEEFYSLGVKIFGPTWDYENAYAYPRKIDKGLKTQGKELVKLMDKKKLIIDAAHLSKKSLKDIANLTNKVIVNTHANVKSICDNPHNMDDEEIQMIIDSGGLVCLMPLVSAVGGQGRIDDFRKHIDYIGDHWGIEYIGISSDIYPLPEYPFMWDSKNILILQRLENELRKYYSDDVLEKIFKGNWMRILDSAL